MLILRNITVKENNKPDDNAVLTLKAFRNLIFPVGSIYISFGNVNAGTFIGGTWAQKSGIISAVNAWYRKS